MGRHLFFSGGAHGGFRWSEGDALGIWWTCDLLLREPSFVLRCAVQLSAFTTLRYVRLLFAGRG
jgi:hypothetical protein